MVHRGFWNKFYYRLHAYATNEIFNFIIFDILFVYALNYSEFCQVHKFSMHSGIIYSVHLNKHKNTKNSMIASCLKGLHQAFIIMSQSHPPFSLPVKSFQLSCLLCKQIYWHQLTMAVHTQKQVILYCGQGHLLNAFNMKPSSSIAEKNVSASK